MSADQIHGYTEAVALAQKRMSPRARHLAMLERWVDGTQYDGKADWFADVPISEKAPCIVEPIVADSIESHVDMVLGESRFPDLTTRPGEDDEDDADDEGALDEGASEAVDRLLRGATEQVRFRALCREALGMAMGCGSVGAVYGARDGRLFGETIKARWCEPEFASDGRTVRALVIQYPYVEQYQERDGSWRARARIFRRTIDATSDVTYAPCEADVAVPKWIPAQQFLHGLGFCPVVWYPFFRGCSIIGQIDGNAPHATLTDEIRAHDIAVSQRHRAAIYAGDPQWTECGVELGSNPSSVGKVGGTPVTADGGPPTSDNPVIGTYHEPQTDGGAARKKHPGTVWQYENEAAKITLHQLNGDALKAISDNASDIRMKLMQSLAYVPLDPEATQVLRGSLSGKALESLRERQLNRDDRIRDDFGDGFMKPSLSMLLRICHVKGAGLRVRGLKRAASVLAGFSVNDEVGSVLG